MNHCFMSCIHKVLTSATPKRQFCGSVSSTKADSKGKELHETNIQWISSFCVVRVVFNGLRSTPIQSKFPKFPGGDCLQIPLKRSACTDHCVLCVPHQPPLFMYSSPSSISGSASAYSNRYGITHMWKQKILQILHIVCGLVRLALIIYNFVPTKISYI